MNNTEEKNILLELNKVETEPELEGNFTATPFEPETMTFIFTEKPGLEGLQELLEAIEPAQCRIILLGKEGPYYKWPIEEDDIVKMVNYLTSGFIADNKISPADAEPLIKKRIDELIELLRKEKAN